jgi:DNA-binding GntR family transcriptional regulator
LGLSSRANTVGGTLGAVSDETPDGAGRRMLSRGLADQLRAEIDQGAFRPGDQLPSYRDLAATRNIAVGTAREAVRLLEQEGRVEIRPGSGAYVRDARAATAEEQLREVRAELAGVRSQLKAVAAALTDAEHRIGRAMSRIRPGAD